MNLNKKILIAIGGFVVFFVIISIIYAVMTASGNKHNGQPSTYTDPNTGQNVVTVPGKTPENTNGHNITLLGFDKLIDDYGMTLDQVKYLETYFQEYSSTQQSRLTEVSVVLKSITTTVNPSTGYISLNFDILVNRKDNYKAKVTYFGIGKPSLTLSDNSNKQLYKSK